jgi:hypothetical protein
VQVRFEQSEDWIIEAELGSGFPGFNEGLYDAISTMPPRGAEDSCPSTYWIDKALEGLQRPETAEGRPIASGNATTFFVEGSAVRVHSADGAFEDETMRLVMFIEILQRWRREVIQARAQGRSGPALDVYRRLPPTRFTQRKSL